ncbi:MAG: hypothetical protein ACXW6K_22375 [Candidatus Binatia bacterium]
MPYIKAVAPGEATGKLKEIYEDGPAIAAVTAYPHAVDFDTGPNK